MVFSAHYIHSVIYSRYSTTSVTYQTLDRNEREKIVMLNNVSCNGVGVACSVIWCGVIRQISLMMALPLYCLKGDYIDLH